MNNLQRGFPLLLQQFKALFRENLLLSWRSKRATFLQLFASFFFIFLMFCIQKAIDARLSHSSFDKSVTKPEPLLSPPIPPCEDKHYTKLPCYDFVWSGNESANIHTIVRAIMANNPGRPIPTSKVKTFRTVDEVDKWLFSNPMRCPGALHFVKTNGPAISYGVQTNSSSPAKRGKFEDPTFMFQVPLQIAAECEIARSLIGDMNFSWVVSFKEFAHPPEKILSAINTAGPPFFLATAMFGFVFQMSSLVAEKELKLRQAMTVMGLHDTAYWFSWLASEGILVFIASILIVLFGMIFRFEFFMNNSFVVLFLVFFLFQINMLGFAFMLSVFITKSSTPTFIGFSIFLIGSVIQFVGTLKFPYSTKFSKQYRILWLIFPPNLLGKALWLLADATSTPQDVGISWSGRAKCAPNDSDCVISISDIYEWLVITFLLWFAMAIYFDNVFPNELCLRKSPLYFLKPGYWTGKGGDKVEKNYVYSNPLENDSPYDEDVVEEENIIKQHISNNIDNPNIAVQIRGLGKVYRGSTRIGYFQCKKTPPYHALKGLWLNFAKDQLFCLLGANKAGKTTTINCLTGKTPVTGGDALVYGHSIRSSTGMTKIQKLIGVCPQFDALWDALSGKEHLYLSASIKGVPPDSIYSAIEKALSEVRLTNEAEVRAGSYSGGMKRRLSIAIALIGDPKLVILDEPTTGVDPITRRQIWNIINDAKKGRAIVLTTHSMEEADILSDRIGIMANGRLRCIGTSVRLKSRFGTGFVANVSFNGRTDLVDTNRNEAVKQFFKQHLDVEPKDETKSFFTFVIPHDKETLLQSFFTELHGRESEFGIVGTFSVFFSLICLLVGII